MYAIPFSFFCLNFTVDIIIQIIHLEFFVILDTTVTLKSELHYGETLYDNGVGPLNNPFPSLIGRAWTRPGHDWF